MTVPLGELATLVRSKNAGPFWVTIDIFFPTTATYERASHSAATDPRTIGDLYRVDHNRIRIFHLPELCAIKISFPRPITQGALRDRDMHAGQQHVPLSGLAIA
ncbi:DUF4387 domain-containing protein [Amycolatopsis sp. cmx-8-4]|uniref:DUF4387 domain-containing protein n=1 Tax=Amycolatopsis sp. cmx-8-4 TaxID=2790947 RepID=UPI003979C8E1